MPRTKKDPSSRLTNHLQGCERDLLEREIRRCQGRAPLLAKTLGISTRTLYEKFKRLDLRPLVQQVRQQAQG